MDLPNDVLELALGMMPACARQWGAARVNKRLHALLSDNTVSISARDPDLPIWMLERILTDIQAGRGDGGCAKDAKPLALLMEARAAAGDLPGLELLRSKGLPWTDKLCVAAAAGGHVQLLRWLRCQSPPSPWGSAKACAEAAAGGGHLQALQFIMQERFLCAWDISVCAEVAAAAGHLPVLQWLADASPASQSGGGGLILDEGACAEAAAAGHEDVLAWLRSIGTPWDARTCVLAAAAAGHIHILRFIAASLGPNASCWDERATAVAAHTGRLPVLRWLRGMAQPCPWGELTCAAAAAAGNLEVLRFLRDQAEHAPCPWDESTTAAAAKAGHLHILMWTQQAQPPAPLDPAACLEAAKYRHPEVTRWLLQEFGW